MRLLIVLKLNELIEINILLISFNMNMSLTNDQLNKVNQKDQKDQVIKILIEASQNINSEEHQKTIFELLLFERKEIAFGELLISILSDFLEVRLAYPNTSEQLYILIYIKNFLQHIQGRKEISLFLNIEMIIQKCLSIYFSDCLNKETKRIYDEIIQSLLHIAQNFKEPLPFFNNLFESIKAQFDNPYLIQDKITDYLSFLTKVIKHFLLFDFNLNESVKFIHLFSVIYDRVISITNGYNDETQKIELITTFILYFSQVCSNCFDSFSNHFRSIYVIDKLQKDNMKTVFFESDSFILLIKKCLTINSDNVIMDINNETGKFNTSLIKSKGMLIELLSIICKKLSGMNLISQYPRYQEMIESLLKGLSSQMISLYRMKDYPREKADNTEQEICQLMNIVKIIQFLTEACETVYGNELFSQNAKTIFELLILPNILPTPLEMMLFEFEPEEYLRQLLDMSTTNNEKLPKTKSFKLLTALSTRIDGFFQALIDLYLDIIDSIARVKEPNKSDGDNHSLYESMINTIHHEHLFEQALQIFTTLSFLFLDDNKALNKLDERIDSINHKLIKISNDYLKSKLCFFYKHNLVYLFNDSQQVISKSFDDSIIFIFNCIMSSNTNKSLILTALNAINNIIFNKKLKKFCGHLVRIYSNQVVSYFRSNKELKDIIQTEEYDSFIKGIINHYLIELEQEAVAIFKYFWEEFNVSLTNSINQGKKKIPFQERNNQVILVKNINFLKRFTSIAKSNQKEIIQEIYAPILSLLTKLSDFLNWDFENDILELINGIIEDIKFVPFDYAITLKQYCESLNSGYDGAFDNKFEEYHIHFIFTFLKHMNIAQIEELKYKDILKEILVDHLLSIPRKTKVDSIYTEHYIYSDLGCVYIMMFWNYFNKKDIIELIYIFNKRMNTLPNMDLVLNLKLAMNIFLLINTADDYEVLNNFNYKLFIIKITQFFPINDCSVIEHEQVARFCSSMVRFIIIQLSCVIDTSNDNEKLIAQMIDLNFEELKVIAKKTQNELKKKCNSDMNSKTEKREYKCGKFNFSTRSTNELKLPSDELLSFSDDDNDESNEVIDEEELEIDLCEKMDQNDSDEAINDEDEDENIFTAINENPFKFDNLIKDDPDEKDNNFLTVKKNTHPFDYYYKKYCDEVIIIQSSQINVFMIFDLMLSDLESNALMLYNKILQSYSNKQRHLINEFRKNQKILMNGLFVYRKIIHMKPHLTNLSSNSNNNTNPNSNININNSS